MKNFNKDFFAKKIKAVGQGLIDNAEYMINTNLENIKDMSLYINFNQEDIPSVDITINFVPNKIIDCYKNNT